MSLQVKFAVLTVLLGLTVVGGLFVALWSVEMLERELAAPYRSTTAVLQELREIKRTFEGQSEVLAGRLETGAGLGVRNPEAALTVRAATEGEREAFLSGMRLSDERLSRLASMPWYEALVGRSNARTLVERIERARSAGLAWVEAEGTDEGTQAVLAAQRRAARREYYNLHEFLERLEGRILAHSESAVAYGETVRRRMLIVAASAVVIAVLAVMLRLTLDRRWVMTPVAELRTAATRIASGDFDHRIPVPPPSQRRDELALLSEEFNHMAEMVRTMQEERVERERLAAVGEMVRRIVHNLRNPMAGIRGLAELSRDDLPEKSRTREKQDRIIAAVDRFEQWLAELLTATAPLAVQPRRAEVRPWLEGIVESHRPMAENKDVAVEVFVGQDLADAVFDPRQLEMAVVALVSNAIQATPRGTRVCVEVEIAARGSQWRILVGDEGPGVPEELRERIFQPYFTTKRDGNGIGLAVGRQIVRAHGGSLTVASGQGDGAGACGCRGAVFEVILPLSGPGAAGKEEGRAEDSGDRGRGESAAVAARDA